MGLLYMYSAEPRPNTNAPPPKNTTQKTPRTSTSSATLVFPRFSACALGKTSFTSFINCFSRELGSLDVVTQTLGSRVPANAYSSSTCVRGAAPVAASSSPTSCRRDPSSARSSVGMGFPSVMDCGWIEGVKCVHLKMIGRGRSIDIDTLPPPPPSRHYGIIPSPSTHPATPSESAASARRPPSPSPRATCGTGTPCAAASAAGSAPTLLCGCLCGLMG